MNEKFIKVIATGFGSGFSPFAPGTAGTIVGILFYYIFSPFPWPIYLLTILALSFLACYVSGAAERIFRQKDPSAIVIDEIAGLLWAMFLITPTVTHVFLAFVLFRIFDIAKVFPANLCERRLPGGYGVVADDVVAGVYANVTLQILIGIWGI